MIPIISNVGINTRLLKKQNNFEIPSGYDNIRRHTLSENDLCILYEGRRNDDDSRQGFISKKYLNNNVCDMSLSTPANKYNSIKYNEEDEISNGIKIHYIKHEFCTSFICDSYIFFCVHLLVNNVYKINFCAQSIFTNTKYLVHELEVPMKHSFRKWYIYLSNNNSSLALYLHPNTIKHTIK